MNKRRTKYPPEVLQTLEPTRMRIGVTDLVYTMSVTTKNDARAQVYNTMNSVRTTSTERI